MAYSIERMPERISIGRETETGVTDVMIDCGAWVSKWPGMALHAIYTQEGGAPYILQTETVGSVLVWHVTDADTATPGTGRMEIVGEMDGRRKVSATVKVSVAARMSGTVGDPPEAASPWVDSVLEAAGRITGMQVQAETLDAGSSATAAWDGEQGLLTIGVPKGEQGPKGENGEKGLQGDPGEPGKDAVVDATLTQSGQAADAKTAGEAVRQLKDDFVEFQGTIHNSFFDEDKPSTSYDIELNNPSEEGNKCFWSIVTGTNNAILNDRAVAASYTSYKPVKVYCGDELYIKTRTNASESTRAWFLTEGGIVDDRYIIADMAPVASGNNVLEYNITVGIDGFVLINSNNYAGVILNIKRSVYIPKQFASRICEEKVNGFISQRANSFEHKKVLDHLFITHYTGYIPHESLYHVRISKSLGFDVIEAHPHKTSDGVYIVNHLDGGNTFGRWFDHVDGVTDISSISVNDVTWGWICDNVRYKTKIAKYRTRPPRLEEFMGECSQQGLIPLVYGVDQEAINIVKSYVGESNYIAYAASREENPGTIISIWRGYTTKEAIIAACDEVGAPMIYGMKNPQDFTDDQLREIITALHDKGYWINTAYVDSDWFHLSALGFDSLSGISTINRIDTGNICNLNSILSYDSFTIEGGAEENGILTFEESGTITPNVSDQTYSLCAFDLQMDFTGSITIPAVGEHMKICTYNSDGTFPFFIAVPVLNRGIKFTISVAAGTIVRDISFKASAY